MKILITATGMVKLPPIYGGAVESYVTDLLRMFSSTNVEVRGVSDYRTGFEYAKYCYSAGSNLDEFPLTPRRSAFAHIHGGRQVAKTAKWLLGDGHKFDVLHTNEEISSYLMRRVKIKKVTTLHNPIPTWNSDEKPWNVMIRGIGWRIVKSYLKQYDHVITLNSIVLKNLKGWQDNMSVIHLPVDIEKFHPIYEERLMRYILYVGRLEPRKNPAMLVDVLSYLDKDVQLIYVGSGSEITRIWSKAKQLGLMGRIKILSNVNSEDLIRYYQNASIFVLPSKMELYPKVAIEAASCGIPVFLPEVELYNDFRGFALNYENIFDLINKIKELLNSDSKWEDISKCSREYCLESLSYRSISKQLLEVYQKI